MFFLPDMFINETTNHLNTFLLVCRHLTRAKRKKVKDLTVAAIQTKTKFKLREVKLSTGIKMARKLFKSFASFT